jgi:glycosyltransferase involved in cell wall biosynthesis
VPEEFLGFREAAGKPEFHVAFVGRFTSVKNPEFLLELATSLKEMGKWMEIRMVTMADGGNMLVRELRGKGVVILPPMDTATLGGFYRRTGVLISPSRFETYGNTPLEAVSSGTPALVSWNMGVGEVFRMLGLTDLITDFSDVRSVIDKIEQMLKEGFRIPAAIAEKIKENLAWPRVISRYLEICAKQAERD